MSRHGWLSLRRSRRLGRAVSQRIDVEAVHRRGWGSLYAALSRGCIDAEALRVLLSHHPLTGGQPPIYAVDVSVWSRCDAEASRERGYYYHPSRHSAGQLRSRAQSSAAR